MDLLLGMAEAPNSNSLPKQSERWQSDGMSRTARFSKRVSATARERLGDAATLKEFKAAQAVLLPACYGLSKAQTAAAIGLSTSRVGAIQAAARRPCAVPRGTHGGRRRQRMSIEEETAFLAPWVERAKTAGMIIVPPLHDALARELGKKIHHSQVYRMPARHGWRKVAPDSTHPKTDPAAQTAWKKTPGGGVRASGQGASARQKAAAHVSRRSPLRANVAPPAVLGTGRHPASDAKRLRT